MKVAELKQKEKQFIKEHLNDDVHKLALKKNIFSDEIRKNTVIHQISSLKKCKGKLDFLLQYDDFIFPKTVSIEQASSEITAFYKANRFKATNSIDLTGGMGIDSIFFAQTSVRHTYNEIDKDLYDIFNHNKNVLGLKNCDCTNFDAFEFPEESILEYDLIYFDPARRGKAGEKKYFIEDTLPNPIDILNMLIEYNYRGKVIIKASPMVDISRAEMQLKIIDETYVISVNNECKEVLFFIDFCNADIYEIDPRIDYCNNYSSEKCAINISPTRIDFFEKPIPDFGELVFIEDFEKYIYEPNSSLMKLACWRTIEGIYDLYKVERDTHLFTSDKLINAFHGRCFELIAEVKPDAKAIKKYLPDNKANIITRNFPMSVDEIKKKFKIDDGGDIYVIFTTLRDNSKKALICRRIY